MFKSSNGTTMTNGMYNYNVILKSKLSNGWPSRSTNEVEFKFKSSSMYDWFSRRGHTGPLWLDGNYLKHLRICMKLRPGWSPTDDIIHTIRNTRHASTHWIPKFRTLHAWVMEFKEPQECSQVVSRASKSSNRYSCQIWTLHWQMLCQVSLQTAFSHVYCISSRL